VLRSLSCFVLSPLLTITAFRRVVRFLRGLADDLEELVNRLEEEGWEEADDDKFRQ
jgi:hypothetical protein